MGFLSVSQDWISRLTQRIKPSRKHAKSQIAPQPQTTQSLEPPTIDWLLAHRSQKTARTQGETPLASLYRMLEFIVLDNTIGLRNEVEKFFNHRDWLVSEIPDPQDPDPARYAFLSVMPAYLVSAFNRLMERGLPRGSPAILSDEELNEVQSRPIVLEEPPKWSASVAKLDEVLIIPDSENAEPPEDSRSPLFLSMNIIVSEPHVLFV